MVISLFLLFAPFCWQSVALSSDSDVPAEAAGMGNMDTVSRVDTAGKFSLGLVITEIFRHEG